MQNSAAGASSPLARGFSAVVGILLLIEGLWGFFRPVVFGVLTTNPLHAAIHVVLGLVGVWASAKGHAQGFLVFLGLLLVVVAILWFIPGTNGLVASLLNVNQAVAYVNLIVGAISVTVGAAGRRRIEFGAPAA